MAYTITLTGMEFKARHGCYDLEKRVGNHFCVDLTMDVDAERAAELDDVRLTVNYLTVFKLVSAQMSIVSNTLENVAKRIVDALLTDFPQIIHVSVTVTKLAPPLEGKIREVSVTFAR